MARRSGWRSTRDSGLRPSATAPTISPFPTGGPSRRTSSRPGYHTIYLQTFRTGGEDLERVNFQTPTTAVYQALAALLDVPLDPDGELRECAIVSTFSTRNVRDLSFRGFTGYGAHGVAGATAFATPALPAPDLLQRERRARPGAATLLGRRRGPLDRRPRRGLHDPSPPSLDALRELRRDVHAGPRGEREPALGSARARQGDARGCVGALVGEWSEPCGCAGCASRGSRRARSCGSPARARIARSSGAPSRSRSGANLDLLGVLGGAGPGLRAGQRLEVLVTAHAYDGKLVRWRLREARAPTPVTRCVPLGNTRPQARCQAG